MHAQVKLQLVEDGKSDGTGATVPRPKMRCFVLIYAHHYPVTLEDMHTPLKVLITLVRSSGRAALRRRARPMPMNALG